MKRKSNRVSIETMLAMAAAVAATGWLCAPAADAATFTSAASGDYQTNATWGGATNPSNGTADTVNVGAHTVTVTDAANTSLDTINLNNNAASLQLLIDGTGSDGTISLGNALGATLSATNFATAITVGNNGGSNTGNTIAMGALTWVSSDSGLVFNSNNGYKISFTGWQATRNSTENRFTVNSGAEVIIASLTNDAGTGSGNRFTKYGAGTMTITNSSIGKGASAMGFTIDANAGTIDFINGLDQSGAGAVSFTKNGAGTVRLLGASSYTGSTTLNAGTVQLGAAGAISNGALTIGGGSTVTMDIRNQTQIYSSAVTFTGAASTLVIAGNQELTLANVNSLASATDASNRTISVTNSGLVTFGYTSGGTVAGILFGGGNSQARTHTFDIAAGSYLRITAALLKTGTNDDNTAIKKGDGVMEWQGANAYGPDLADASTTSTDIQAGTLLLTGSGVIPNNILLSGGVLAQGTDFTRALGTSKTTFRFATGTGGGGFAAFGNPINVTPGAASWGTSGTASFLPNNAPLIFGSSIADNVVTYTSDINLKAGTAGTDNVQREIRVNDNANSAIDSATISGVISNTASGFGITKTGSGKLTLSNSNSYNGATIVSAGILDVTGSIGNSVSLSVASSAQAFFTSGLQNAAATVTIDAGGKVTMRETSPNLGGGWPGGTGAAVSVIGGLTLTGTAKLDLYNNDLVIDYSGDGSVLFTNINDAVRTGYAGGAWNGSGINSTTAGQLNYFTLLVLDTADTNDNYQPGSGGPTVDATSVVVKFTHQDDLNGDGTVDATDKAIFTSHYSAGATGATHRFGDMDFDGTYTFNDVQLFNLYYNTALPSLPEPTSLALLALGAAGLLTRKRR